MYNFFRFLVLFILTFATFFVSLDVLAVQKSFDYRMPFRAGEIWKNDMDHGVHTDKTGYGIDLYPTGKSTWDIVAPADGVITRGCTVNDVTYLALSTAQGDIFRFVHMDANTVPIQQGYQKNVVRGETLGKISGAKIAEDSKCFLSSELPHTHFSWLESMCPLQIDGYTFTCDNLKDCGGANIYSVKCNQVYLGQEFKSTNEAVTPSTGIKEGDYCETFKNSNFKFGDTNPLVIGLQKCLKKVGMFDWAGGFTGYFGRYTENKFNEWKNVSKPVVANSAVNNCDTLKNSSFKIGDSGSQIVELQKCLQSAGLFSWPEGFTGYFGNYTSGKFNEWKNSNQTPAPATAPTPVTTQSKPTTPEECKNLPYQQWYMTQRDEAVSKLQNCLKTMGYFNYSTTGYFGNMTRAAYEAWTSDINSGKR
jgi:peptidoglycan hydrolase-like protein with peptidoglycan-binding domain